MDVFEFAPIVMKLSLTGFVVSLFLLGSLGAEESGEPAETKNVTTPSSGTSVYDSESINELYAQYKKENEKRSREQALIGDMDTFVLKEFEVQGGGDLISERELEERLNLRPQNRINRIARVNPEAAAEIQYALRSDQVFFSPESNPRITGGDPGATADLSVGQIGAVLTKIGSLFGGKKKDNNAR